MPTIKELYKEKNPKEKKTKKKLKEMTPEEFKEYKKQCQQRYLEKKKNAKNQTGTNQ